MASPSPVPAASTLPAPFTFSRYQKGVVGLLAFLQFTIILDFMILSPLGALLMPALRLSASQFGWVVSAYAFSAGASGLLAAGFADRFDRKKLLLFFYTGFLIGTLFCALAQNYVSLLAARTLTGIFGGVIGAVVFAITTDLFPLEVRGRVMGVVQTAFAASQVLGIPVALFLANHGGWHAPFLLIVGTGVVAAVGIAVFFRPINAHLLIQKDRSAFEHLYHCAFHPRYVAGYGAMALLSTGGFMLMPFSSAFLVQNVGLSFSALPMIYIATGTCAIVAGPIVGRLTDSVGKFKVFFVGTTLSILMVILYTHLGHASLGVVILVNSILFIAITTRIISSSALLSAVPKPADRGAFMSINSSLQQISGGLAAVLAGWIVVQAPQGPLEHFDLLGYVVSAASVITIVMMYRIHRRLLAD